MNCKTCGKPCRTSSVYCCFACELAYRARDKAQGDEAKWPDNVSEDV